ncbi:MAG: hypothetical protein NDI69_14010 [Bacteriovoracaceae bacterium]|nr:hypothetical protein [Bacteriovoracaceae bacterium]
MHLSWKLKAAKTANTISCYYSVDEFINDSANLDDMSLIIYIDSDLGEDTKGEIEAKKLSAIGFKNLYITTGYTDFKTEDYPWIKGVISKHPPF